MEQRRILIALVISLVFVVAYQELILNRYRRTRTGVPEPAPSTQTAAPEPETGAPPTPSSGELGAPAGESSISVDTDVLRIVLTPVGARLADIDLKLYRQTVNGGSPPLDIVQPSPVLPGTLQVGTKESDAAVAYRADRTELTLHGDERGEIVFVGESAAGLHVEKRYAFSGNGYLFDLTATISGERPIPELGLILTPLPAENPRARGQVALGLADRHLVEKPTLDLLKQPIRLEASWAGFAAQYFLAVAMPRDGTLPAMLTSAGELPIVRLDAPVEDGRAAFVLYTGPKERDTLTRAGHDLDRALDFGWFWFVAIPLLRALRIIDRVTGNYGVAIIVLTALVKIATMPLTRVTFRNMREMQKIQPQMAKLRERFKDDQVALQKEMMELYRRHRVNPFSGCLPMLLQLPIFVGLYNALLHSIELRHAPFALWIRDLSAPDRLMIAGVGVPVLTLLMGVSMFVQQWLTPQQGDPTQQRMMMFMPLVFTFMFINFPAGLVLYWLVNNVLTIGQQYVMMRSMK